MCPFPEAIFKVFEGGVLLQNQWHLINCHGPGSEIVIYPHTHYITVSVANVSVLLQSMAVLSVMALIFTSHVIQHRGGSRGLVVKVLDSKFEGCEFKTHTGHGSFSKLRQFRLPYFASVYSAANEYKHCLEGTCDGLVSCPGESV